MSDRNHSVLRVSEIDCVWCRREVWVELQRRHGWVHISHLVQNWLSDNADMVWSKEFWPPNSPDLNPLDFYLWSEFESVTNRTRYPNITSLRITIEAAFANMDRDTLKQACERFRPKMEAVIQAGEGILSKCVLYDLTNNIVKNTFVNFSILAINMFGKNL